MQSISLHYFKTRTTLVKYLLVVSLLLSIAGNIFTELHNPAHSLPFSLPQLFVPLLSEYSLALVAMNYVELFVRTTGNRDPPIIS